jgi:hypothetical protein
MGPGSQQVVYTMVYTMVYTSLHGTYYGIYLFFDKYHGV